MAQSAVVPTVAGSCAGCRWVSRWVSGGRGDISGEGRGRGKYENAGGGGWVSRLLVLKWDGRDDRVGDTTWSRPGDMGVVVGLTMQMCAQPPPSSSSASSASISSPSSSSSEMHATDETGTGPTLRSLSPGTSLRYCSASPCPPRVGIVLRVGGEGRSPGLQFLDHKIRVQVSAAPGVRVGVEVAWNSWSRRVTIARAWLSSCGTWGGQRGEGSYSARKMFLKIWFEAGCEGCDPPDQFST